MRKPLAVAAVVAMVIMRATTGSAADRHEEGNVLLPEYRAVVIYTAAEGGPELREIFGQFGSLQECLVHAQARTQAMIQRKELYGGEPFCLYREDEKAKPKLLR